MKKIVVIMLALVLAVPAISLAGSVGSRWDINIGGTVKFDVGYASQGANSNSNGAARETTGPFGDNDSTTAFRNLREAGHIGNFFMNGAETSLNFFVKGPDAYGAKTSAFIAADFTGQWAGANNGVFNLNIAKFDMTWPTFGISAGFMPGLVGAFPTFSGNCLAWGCLNQFDAGFPHIAQVVLTKNFTKEWKVQLGAIEASPFPPGASAASTNNGFTRSGHPGVETAITYSTDKCGKVGPWQLTAKTSGLWARERRTAGMNSDGFADAWLADFTVLVPIIPEKKGNKTGAMYFDGIVFTQQNAGINAPAPVGTAAGTFFWPGVQQRDLDDNFRVPVISGVEGHVAYYFTDSLWMNAFYGNTSAKVSKRFKASAGNMNSVVGNQRYIVNIMKDLSPAIRIGLEYYHIRTQYANALRVDTDPTVPLDGILDTTIGRSSGKLNVIRAGAYYFF